MARHEPEVDLDGDGFSTIPTLRGSNWRGKDCDPINADIHPGRRSSPNPSVHDDFNCNGISGTAPSGKAWKDELCGDSPHIGVISIGDSAGAHFAIPPQYLNASEIDEATYDRLLYYLSDEFDHPNKGGYTGFVNSSKTLPYADSVYKFMREHNRCAHRDFQSLCVNGARSGAILKILETMSRSNKTDHAALVFFELIGNDVCSPHHSFDTMTTVAEFRANIMAALRQLDNQLPPNSTVVTVDLADGLVLWDAMHARLHPIGVTYKTVYDFLNCLTISPCWVWMNSNATVRETGQKRANALSAVYGEIIRTETFRNFRVLNYPFPLKAILADWEKLGGELWQLIEPVDGFHPGQIANSLSADWFWKQLQKDAPKAVGPKNPHNNKIIQLFGDQGGY